MKPDRPDRRAFILSSAALAGSAFAPTTAAEGGEHSPGSVRYHPPSDPTKELGRPLFADRGYGTRSQFESEIRAKGDNPTDYSSWTYSPLASMQGNLTPSGLHFERHHGGIPTIDPNHHSLIVHGHINEPKRFSMDVIKQLPSITRKCFIECSGNSLSEWRNPTATTVQESHGLLSTSEWTGVSFATLVRELGVHTNASWVLGEGADAAVMTRSIPMDRMMSDGIIAYGQNGEAIRPEQGYPLRLILPGLEGNTHIKWLRRLQLSDQPFMTREETSKYTDLMPDGRAKLFTLLMEAKSVITFPSGGMNLLAPGEYEIRGLAWSGKGSISSVDISVDGGATWVEATVDSRPQPMCTVRFTKLWRWDGSPAVLQSRCTDETGDTQPTRAEIKRQRGVNAVYHYNAIQQWFVSRTGTVTNGA